MSIYKEVILAHYHKPHNQGVISDADSESHVQNSVCGDKMHFTVKITDGKVDKVMFEGDGCAISVASASLLTDAIKNKDDKEVLEMDTGDVLELLGISLSPNRIKCALLSLEGIQKALKAGT